MQPGYDQGYPQGGYQQPQQQQVVIVNQPVETNTRYGQPQNIKDWSSGLCGCCEDCSSCCYAYWCYPCFLCTLSTTMGEHCCGPICCGAVPGCSDVLLGGYGAAVSPNTFLVGMRSKLRAQHGIRGSVCDDICCIWCCQFCATTQMHREMKHLI